MRENELKELAEKFFEEKVGVAPMKQLKIDANSVVGLLHDFAIRFITKQYVVKIKTTTNKNKQ